MSPALSKQLRIVGIVPPHSAQMRIAIIPWLNEDTPMATPALEQRHYSFFLTENIHKSDIIMDCNCCKEDMLFRTPLRYAGDHSPPSEAS
jgi:hypothetical protein